MRKWTLMLPAFLYLRIVRSKCQVVMWGGVPLAEDHTNGVLVRKDREA